MLTLLIVCTFLAALFLPKKHAFGLILITQALYIVPGGIDISSYAFLILFLRANGIKFALRGRLVHNPLITLYALFFFFSTLSATIYQGPLSLNILITYLRIFFVVLLFFEVFRTVADLFLFCKYVALMLTLVILHIYTSSVGLNPFVTLEYRWGRLMPHGLTDQYVNPNSYSIVIVWSLGILMIFFWIFRTKLIHYARKRLSLMVLILLLASLPILGLLSSRSSIIVLILVCLLAILRSRLKGFTFAALFLIGILPILDFNYVGSSMRIPFLGESTIERFQEIGNELDERNNWSRLALAKAGLKVFLENPLLGVGVGNEVFAVGKMVGKNDKTSHNTLIGLVAEFGLFGIFLITYFFWLWRNSLYLPTTIAFLVLFGAYALVHNVLLMTITWLVLAFNYKLISLQSMELSKLRR